MATVKTNVIQIDTAPAAKSVKDLRSELKALKDQMAGMEEGSDSFLKAANKAGELKHQMDAINQSVRGASADFGDMLGNASKVSAALVGGFQAAKAALSMFGVESEEVTKSIKTMQNLMAMTQGLSAFDEGIKSLNKLRNSIQGTTVVAKAFRAVLQPKALLAVAVAIGAITLAYKALTKQSREAAEMQKTFNSINEKGIENSKNEITKIQMLATVARDETQSLNNRKAAIEQLNKIVPTYNGQLDETTGKYVENKEALDNYIQSLLNQATAEAAMAEIQDKAAEVAKLRLKYQSEYTKEQEKQYRAIVKNSGQAYADLWYPNGASDVKVYTGNHRFQGMLNDIAKGESEISAIYKKYSGLISQNFFDTEVKNQKNLTEVKKLEYDKDLDALEHMYDQGLITADEYYEKLKKLAKESPNLLNASDASGFTDKTIQKQFKELNDQLKDGSITAKQYVEQFEEISKRSAKATEDYYEILYKRFTNYQRDFNIVLNRFNDARKRNAGIAIKDLVSGLAHDSELAIRGILSQLGTDVDSAAILNIIENQLNSVDHEVTNILMKMSTLNKDIVDTKHKADELIKDLTTPKEIKESESEYNKLFKLLNQYYMEGYITLDQFSAALDGLNKKTIESIKEVIVEEEELGEDTDDTLINRIRTTIDAYTQVRLTQVEIFEQTEEDLNRAYSLGLINYEQYLTAMENLTDEKNAVIIANSVDITREWGAAMSSVGDAITATVEARRFQLEQEGKFSEQEKKNYASSLEVAKKFNIAGVVISTLAGIANATASIWSPNNAYLTVWGQIAMQAAITTEMLATMAAQIAQIKQQSGSSLGSVSSAATSSLIAPVAYTNSVQGASERNARDTRVYVTEHDITDTQRRVQVAQSEARF